MGGGGEGPRVRRERRRGAVALLLLLPVVLLCVLESLESAMIKNQGGGLPSLLVCV